MQATFVGLTLCGGLLKHLPTLVGTASNLICDHDDPRKRHLLSGTLIRIDNCPARHQSD